MPKVSVVIPTHNRADLLCRAVRSVLAQTERDLEVLVGDDASTDGTREALARLNDPRITHLRHRTNQGVSAARNTAIANAKGDYVAFLDDDDEWMPNKLSVQLERMEKAEPGVGLICSGYYCVDSATGRITSETTPTERGWVYELILEQGTFSHTSTIMVKRECFQRVGVFDTSYNYAEDFDMWLRIAREYAFEHVEAPLSRLCFQPNGLSQNYHGMIVGTELHLNKYSDYYRANPAVLQRRLELLGTYHCVAGNAVQGRQAFYAALALRPASLKAAIGATLSLAGPTMFRLCCTSGIWHVLRRMLGHP